jgi:hypothetical protein
MRISHCNGCVVRKRKPSPKQVDEQSAADLSSEVSDGMGAHSQANHQTVVQDQQEDQQEEQSEIQPRKQEPKLEDLYGNGKPYPEPYLAGYLLYVDGCLHFWP